MNEEQLLRIKQQVAGLGEWLERIVDAVIEENVSNYPILVFSDTEVEIGMDLRRATGETHFLMRISTMEEFAVKGMISDEHLENFKEVYKDPSTNFCLFVIENQSGSFIFLPRKHS